MLLNDHTYTIRALYLIIGKLGERGEWGGGAFLSKHVKMSIIMYYIEVLCVEVLHIQQNGGWG